MFQSSLLRRALQHVKPCHASRLISSSTINQQASKFKVMVYDTKSFDKEIFDAALEQKKLCDKISFTYNSKLLTSETVGDCKGFDGICIFVNDDASRPIIPKLAANGVKLITLRCTGFNKVDLKAATEHNIKTARAKSYTPHAVSEFAVASYLALSRKLIVAHERTTSRNFSIEGLVGSIIYGKTVGIMGLGKIGKWTAKIFRGMGAHVVAYDPILNYELAEKIDVKYEKNLDEFFRKCDVICMHCPFTGDNYHIINADAISKMKHGVYIINVARGQLMDTKALHQGLKSGKIAGASLDVYEQETGVFFHDFTDQVLLDDQLAALLACPNVLVTSHYAYLTKESLHDIADLILETICDFIAGKPLAMDCNTP